MDAAMCDNALGLLWTDPPTRKVVPFPKQRHWKWNTEAWQRYLEQQAQRDTSLVDAKGAGASGLAT